MLELCPVAPDVTLDPDNVKILGGMSATFLCAATGRPRPTITWYRTIDDSDTLERVNVLDNRVTVIENTNEDRELMSNLTVTNVRPSDTATYICIAENGVNIEMSNATLTVNGKIVIHLFYYTCIHDLCVMKIVTSNMAYIKLMYKNTMPVYLDLKASIIFSYSLAS